MEKNRKPDEEENEKKYLISTRYLGNNSGKTGRTEFQLPPREVLFLMSSKSSHVRVEKYFSLSIIPASCVSS